MRKTLNDIKDVKNDPLIFIAKQLLGLLGAWIIIVILVEVIILVLLGLGGFSHVFGGMSGIARFFFWIFSVAFVGELFFLGIIWRAIVRVLKRQQENLKKQFIDIKVTNEKL